MQQVHGEPVACKSALAEETCM